MRAFNEKLIDSQIIVFMFSVSQFFNIASFHIAILSWKFLKRLPGYN